MKGNNKAEGEKMSYQVYANGDKKYATTSAKKAADVAVTWRQNGLNPRLWTVTGGIGPITTRSIAITTKAATAKAACHAESV